MDINEAFKHTFNALFGKEGEQAQLDDFKGYLPQYVPPRSRRKSAISGKDVAIVTEDYCKGANFISQDEIRNKDFPSLNINEIKDIDGILGAIDERLQYTGNKVLGKSDFVEDTDICVDSFYVRGCSDIQQSKYVGYSRIIRDSQFVFGSNTTGKGNYIIRCVAYNITRCFETYYIADSNDCYFSYDCSGCSNVMFSFNQRGSRYLIGNLALPKDRYLQIKDKLLAEIREHLLKNKSFPSLFTIPEHPEPWQLPKLEVKERKAEQNPDKIEKAFAITTKIMFGKELSPLSKFEAWLSRHTATVEKKKTPFGGYTSPSFSTFPFMRDIKENQFVTNEEAMELGKLAIDLKTDEELSISKIFSKAGKIAYYSPEAIYGSCRNIIECPVVVDSIDLYKVVDATAAKNAAISGQVFSSEYIFGSFRTTNSKFCINCYHSLALSNCFEMDSCSNCRDSMFCHNCENLDNCMFCFNTKSKRYAIGNVEVGRDQYLKIREKLLKAIVEQLGKTGDLDYDIYNIACKVNKDA